MDTTLTTAPGRHDHPPQPSPEGYAQSRPRPRRVGLLDRLALHLGLALIKWGRRNRAIETRETRARRIENELARQERARLAERALRLGSIPR